MTTAEWLARARAVTDAATPGPWRVTPWHDKGVMPAGWADDTLAIEDRGPFMHVAASDAADAAFIAASRTMLPAAVAAIEAALALHIPVWCNDRNDYQCADCGADLTDTTPDCPTVRALTAALDPR